jgi:hypothetical protein
MEKLASGTVLLTTIVPSTAIVCEDSQVMLESLPNNTDVPRAVLFLKITEGPV